MKQILILFLILLAPACEKSDSPPDELIVYAAVDRSCAEPLIAAWEQESGIRIKAVFDNESAKTAGLARRLILEKKDPRADVWWSGESLFTARLSDQGCFTAPKDPSTQGPWKEFALRLRVLVFHAKTWKRPPPTSIRDLARPELRGEIILARPNFGTSATHATWLLANAPGTLEAIAANSPLVVPGNAHVVESIHRGQALLGLCDSDDVLIAKTRDPGLRFVIPDQDAGGLGVIATPASAAVVHGAPHEKHARAFVEWLASPRGESLLAATPSRNLPLSAKAQGPKELPRVAELKLALLDQRRLAQEFEKRRSQLRRLFP